jgi:hypothetical protein
MSKPKMLYVWKKPFNWDDESTVCAVASSPEEARRNILRALIEEQPLLPQHA